MSRLDDLENESIHIIREAYSQIDDLAMLWSLGKDSNVMIWLARKAFLGTVPFPVIHLDTEAEFPETYAFRDDYTRTWGLRLIADVCPPLEDMDPTLPPAARFAARKTEGLKRAIETYGFKGVFLGIRRDEQAVRAKERVFSARDETGEWNYRDQQAEFWGQYNTTVPPGWHLRIHPLLHWTEIDIWTYIAREKIPLVPLYFAKDGYRYRSLGEKGTTEPVPSDAVTVADIIAELTATRSPERAGRRMDHEAEDAFERLRRHGYM